MTQQTRRRSVARRLGALWSPFRRVWKRRNRKKDADEPLYFGRLKHLGTDEWRAALSQSPENAARWVYAAATYGDIHAQLMWGQMLLDGYGTRRDPDGAFRWFSIASKSERGDAINMLGRCHERGWGVPVDFEKAAECYAEAARKSDKWAQFNLACLMLDGKGVARDPGQAFALFVKGAQEGHMKSLNMVAHCHEHGLGCPPDQAAALDWYRRSAHAGDFRGQYRYGQLLYEQGAIDDAASWLRLAVDNAPLEFCRPFAAELLGHAQPCIHEVGLRADARASAPR